MCHRVREATRDNHLPRYLAEFDRRWSPRKDRASARNVRVIETEIGRRVTYAEIIC